MSRAKILLNRSYCIRIIFLRIEIAIKLTSFDSTFWRLQKMLVDTDAVQRHFRTLNCFSNTRQYHPQLHWAYLGQASLNILLYQIYHGNHDSPNVCRKSDVLE